MKPKEVVLQRGGRHDSWLRVFLLREDDGPGERPGRHFLRAWRSCREAPVRLSNRQSVRTPAVLHTPAVSGAETQGRFRNRLVMRNPARLHGLSRGGTAVLALVTCGREAPVMFSRVGG